MIFIDSNVPMYLIGQKHPNKQISQITLAALVAEKRRLVTSAEVFQEILHRYRAIERKDAIPVAFETLRNIVDEVLPITEGDVVTAKQFLLTHERLSARDALHAAIMSRHRISTIFSFDTGFDHLPNIHRLPEPPSLSQ